MSADDEDARARPPAALRQLATARYVTPLREGGSLPAIVEADDGVLYVAKFRGAGQGARALVAEIIAGELARVAGLRVPELALLELDAAVGRTEPDPEIRDLLVGSAGLNLAMGYVTGALPFDVAAGTAMDGALASAVVVLDAFVMNVDRTARNPNMLWQRGQLWLIDHGAALYWHHGWQAGDAVDGARAFPRVAEHVLLPAADRLAEAGEALRAALSDDVIEAVVALVPDAWLADAPPLRDAYLTWLRARRAALPTIIDEATRARQSKAPV